MHTLLLVLAALFPAPPLPQAPPASAAANPAAPAKPQVTAWVEVARVVDGDTIHVKLAGKLEKLRLLCVDTEEKLGSGASSPTKPQTVFGEACALWAQEFFQKLEKDGAPAKIGLLFPPGRENHRDTYGRLLCHVILPDGTDYNVMIVKLGKSPYFTKYGYSEIAHAEFVAAQAEARSKKIGIWDPATNAPQTAGAPSAARPYDRLLPWWDMRAEAVRAFTELRAKEPKLVFEAESGASLAEAVAAGGLEATALSKARVFGEIDRVFEEADGSETVLFRAAVRDEALRVRIPKEAVAALAGAKLAQRGEEFQQNYVWYRGRIERDGKGFRSTCSDPAAWSDGRKP
ncbi:MAG: thermonuclease family protein [Planctomycetota bacterium]|nr:thermonuclease family protein [Planctomycetota bacterium]